MINNRQWPHHVSLVETLRKIYVLTLKVQGQELTSGQGHVMAEMGHVAYQTMRIDDTNTMKPSPNVLSPFNQVSDTKLFVASNNL